MSTAVEQLLARIDNDDPFEYRPEDLHALHIEAANERFQKARKTMPVLEQRAADAGAGQIAKIEDILPLFFSDATYKSYPESLVTERNWKALGTWLDATSVESGAADIDMSGVHDIDEWLLKLRAAGHFVYASSGTSGRCSLYQSNEQDREFDRRVWQLKLKWTTGALPDKSRAVFALFPSQGPMRMMDSFGRIVKDFGRADASYFLSDEPLRLSGVNALGRLRQEMASGSAKPGDIGKIEQQAAEREAKMRQSMERLADAVIRHREEPAFFFGTWSPLFALTKMAREKGWSGGAHPGSIAFGGGGLKGIVLPADYREQIQAALGLPPSRYIRMYGLSELTTGQPGCSGGRYHYAPWVIPMVLDKEGENLVEPSGGKMTGRMAFFDLSLNGRWGALISGDHGTVHLDRCPCGRSSPSVADSVVRYTDLPGGDDRVQCAGTIDAYIRGMIGAVEQ